MFLAPGCRGPAGSDAPSTHDSGPPESIHYEVEVDADLSELHVHMCWTGNRPKELFPSGEGGAHLLALQFEGRDLPHDGGRVQGRHLRANACIDYSLDLEGLADESRLGFHFGAGRTALIKSSTWLWQPPRPSAELRLSARFEMPETMEAATAWTIDEQETHHFDRSVFEMRSFTMLGRLSHQRFEASGARFDVVRPELAMALSPEGERAWIEHAARAMSTLYGRFPRERMQILLSPINSWGSSPVPFGMANRGGGPSIILLVNANAPDEDFVGEWSTIHEMLHFGMPFVQAIDAWFSEGYATYYQEVLRARASLYRPKRTPDEGAADAQVRSALEHIEWGLGRAGRSSTLQSLRDASRLMHERGSYQRVYWGGAGTWMRIDLALRQATDGTHGADDLVREIWSCCAEDPGVWTAERLLEIVERKSRAWSPQAERALRATLETALDDPHPPDFASSFADLGVEFVDQGVQLRSEPAAAVTLRDAIFSPEVHRF